MNELQVKLTGDITALVSALNKAKATIKSFESDTEKGSDKGNVGFRRKIGLIEQLTAKSKTLRTALSRATNEQQIENYNRELENTTKEMTRLNALGRSVGANLGNTANGFGQIATKGANANGVAIEFNRIIQDAPFGLIGIGNNLQQLAGNFAQVSKQAGGTGKAVAASLSAMVSPVNLGLLAISALTAGFTAYQMGAFDSILATEDVGKAAEEAATKLEDYRNSLDAVSRASIEGAANAEKEVQSFQLLRSQAENANIPLKDRVEAVRDLKDQYPEYLSSLSEEQILTGNVGDAYKGLTNQIIATAKARAYSDEIAKNSITLLTLEEKLAKNKVAQDQASLDAARKSESTYINVGSVITAQEAAQGRLNDLQEEQISILEQILPIKESDKRLTDEINNQITQGARFTEEQKAAVKEVNASYDDQIALVEMINKLKSESGKKFLDLSGDLDVGGDAPIIDVPVNLVMPKVEVGGTVIGEFIKQIQGRVSSLKEFQEALNQAGITSNEFFAGVESGAFESLSQYDEFINKFMETNELIAESVGVIEAGIENTIGDVAFAIGDALANGGNVLEAGGAALLGGLAAVLSQLGQLAIGTGIALIAIKKSFESLGGVGAIVAGVALIALSGFVSAKSKSLGKSMGSGGGGGSIGGGGGGGVPAQIFTNAQAAKVPSQTNPSGTSGSIDFDREQGKLEATVSGEDIVFVYDRYQERKKGGG